MMSLFKKPKKNIRRRIGSSDEDELGEENNPSVTPMEVEDSVVLKPAKEIKSKKKDTSKKTLLSFEEDLNEGDDGEVFKVKKSSQSKKLMKLLDRERKKKKEVKNDDEVEVIKVDDKTETTEVVMKDTVLNGRAAEVAGCNDLSSDEDSHPKFSRPSNVKLMLERGHIPDAAMIHAARKRRQQARDSGAEYIPINNTTQAKKESEKSRLVHEDDEISDDDEERIEMEVNKTIREREKRRETFLAAQDEEEIEEDEWESQQIRKGVTGAQLAAVQQEAMYNAYPSPVHVMAPMLPEDIILERKTEAATPESVVSKLRDRLAGLKQVHRAHQSQLDSVVSDLVSTSDELKRLEAEAPILAARFRFYQELRGYVTDLVECLDEKVPVIEALEQRVLTLLRNRTNDMMERRRQDIRDQSDEITRVASIKRPKEEEEARTRRAAEREGRRLRRRRAREARQTTTLTVRHQEGMSSDEEVTEIDANAFRSQMQQIESDRSLVFADVVEDFSSVRSVSQKFERWRTEDWSAYQEAYVSLCIPKVLGPLIRLQLISWSPLEEGEDLEKSSWFDVLVQYGLGGSEVESKLREDPDLLLIPRIIEKMMIVKITQMVDAQWDPMSTTQTLRLVSLLNRLLADYPSLLPTSKTLTQLFKTIVEKMRQAVDQDVYIPILPKQSEQSRSAVFFERQFGSAVKLLRNMLAWQGLLSDDVLCEVGLSALLNRYLLTAVRGCDPVDSANKCIMIASTFPRWWFQSPTPIAQLQPYVVHARHLVTLLEAMPAVRDLSERLSHIVASLQAPPAS